MSAGIISWIIIIGLPIVLILLQVWLTRQHIPWMGMVAAIFILLFAVVLLFNANKVIIANCPDGQVCGELGIVTAMLVIYGYVVLALITIAGHVTLWYFRARVWQAPESGGLWKPLYWLVLAVLLVPLVLQLLNPPV